MEPNFYYSQNSLGIFKRCPKMFEYIYIDGISGKEMDPKLKKRIEAGTNFHILAERYFNGMKDYFYIKDGELLEWMAVLEEKYPEDIDCRSEFEIRQNKDGIKLMAKYDLVVIDNDKIKIVDISMEYFQLNYPENQIFIKYNEKKHEINKKILRELIDEINKNKKNLHLKNNRTCVKCGFESFCKGKAKKT
jgi:CRISPR/Cas system-associated exonuclease Cas4 (RecB family)